MLFAVFKASAYLGKKDRAVFLRRRGFPLFRGKGRVFFFKLVGAYKGNFARQVVVEERIFALYVIRRLQYGGVNAAHGIFQVFFVAVFAGDYLFPVPLVDVERMQTVGLFVAANGVHIGIKTGVHLKAVAGERHALPLGE